jgi:hypothetical protein
VSVYEVNEVLNGGIGRTGKRPMAVPEFPDYRFGGIVKVHLLLVGPERGFRRGFPRCLIKREVIPPTLMKTDQATL